ncbi:MAG: TonB-dependent receptor [Prevotellaceae bacterium]|nr:TonB-dependent receptor [Prevotellaceae bacterium]
MLGHESYKYDYNYLYASMKGEIMTGNNELSNYTEVDSTPTSYTNKYRTEGYFMRVSYDYDNRYFASASFRRDGSSRFYKDSRWGNFWSVGAGWSISREKFMEDVSWVDNLKIRLSYGSVGNDDINGYYPWVASYTPSNNGSEAGYVQSSLGNKDLQWEVSHNFDVGLEFGFLDVFSGTLEYFHRKSSNLLFSVPLSMSSGFDSQDKNAGSMYNAGIELDLTAKVIHTQNWNWELGVNGTFLKNRITYLPIDAFMSDNVFKIEEGHSRYSFYLRQWEGVDPETGNCIYKPAEDASDIVTVNGQQYTTSVNDAAYDYAGTSIPKLSGGFSTSLSYKNISLSASFYYQLGGKMYDTTYCNLMTPNQRSYNTLSTDILARWQKPGDITNVPRLIDGSDATDLIGEYSTRWLVTSNMLELATMTLSYTFPTPLVKKWGLGSLAVYVSGDNLFQVTARQGIYPRQYVSGYTNNGDTYAPARAFTAGINLTF